MKRRIASLFLCLAVAAMACVGLTACETETGPVFSEGLEFALIEADTAYSVVGIGECVDSNIVIPENHEGMPVTEIGEKAFYGCGTILSVKIPTSVKKIHDKAFSDCEKLVDISMPDEVEIGVDVFRGSIYVNIVIKHTTVFVPAKEATCEEPGNIAYYYCEACDLCYADSRCNQRLYDVTVAPSHNFVNGVCDKCNVVQDTLNIVSVDKIPNLGKFALGTLENAIGLPQTVHVYTADGELHELPVVWDTSAYDKSKVGEYTIRGTLQAGKYHFAEGVNNYVEASLEITEAMKGTADIVFVLDISGSMGEEVDSVKNNIIQFASLIEAQGVSVRWSVITYSDFTEPGENEKSVIINNGASNWFTSVETYREAIASIELAYGGDTPEAAVDGLLLANTLEHRKDARVFYVLLTDADYKNDNNYGVADMDETIQILDGKGVNVSVITSEDCYSDYRALTETTGGVLMDIETNFAQALFDRLIPIIYADVIA